MGLFSSKTKYYVSSSSFPLFDDVNRVNQYEAAMLDYTANSEIELSEYIKIYYQNSRLPGYRSFLNWWEQQGNFDTFGKITAQFYGDANLEYTDIASGMKQYVDVEDSDVFSVYSAQLSFFSEDFWIKHLATQQGYANKFYQESDLDYEIDYPTTSTIRATLSDGTIIEGDLPNYTIGTRFLNISWSILRTTTNTSEDNGTTVTTTSYTYIYGYYCYQENSGNTILDEIISSENTEEDDTFTFLPVVPIRTDTSWYSEPYATKIADALDKLQIFGTLTDTDSYSELQSIIEDGMEDGSIDDIDYITLILAVSIGSAHQSDIRYMYEFFYNLHTNYRLRNGISSAEVYTPKSVDSGEGNWKAYVIEFLPKIQSDTSGSSFTISCSSSNLSYTYEWDGSDYFECNGQFKPDAEVGEYGVLSGQFTYSWTEKIPATDSEGQLIYTRPDGSEDGWELQYETVTYSTDFSLTLFCHQESASRWRFVSFTNLGLINLIYHGKTIYTSAHSGIMDATGTATVTHEFSQDFPSAPGEFYNLTFYYATVATDGTNAFVVPLEQNTFTEIGAVNALEIAYGSQYLIYNCWESKKVRWYQRGFFSVAVSFIGIVLGEALSIVCPLLGGLVVLYFGTMLTIIVTAKCLELALKTLQCIFGESLGSVIYTTVRTIVLFIVTKIVAKIPIFGWAIAAAIMFTVVSAEALNNGESMSDAVKKGLVAGVVTGISMGLAYTPTEASTAMNGMTDLTTGKDLVVSGTSIVEGLAAGSEAITAGIQGLATGFSMGVGSSLMSGSSIGEAFKEGAISGAISGVSAGLSVGVSNKPLVSTTWQQDIAVLRKGFEEVSNFETLMKGGILTNPNTYVKLMGLGIDQVNLHKLKNIESEYAEFNNNAEAANNVLKYILLQASSTSTSEFVCKLQLCIGSFFFKFDEMLASITPSYFYSISTLTGSELCTSTTQSICEFCENKLAEEGYSPNRFYDNTQAWYLFPPTG